MELTKEQQAMLDGAQGETMAKVMKTLIMYGEIFGAKAGAGDFAVQPPRHLLRPQGAGPGV